MTYILTVPEQVDGVDVECHQGAIEREALQADLGLLELLAVSGDPVLDGLVVRGGLVGQTEWPGQAPDFPWTTVPRNINLLEIDLVGLVI